MSIELTPISSASQDANWIRARLPAGCDTLNLFTKNGLSHTVAEAIGTALDDNNDNKYLALADLLDTLAADYKTYSERAGGGAWARERLSQMSEHWRGMGEDGVRPGSFQFVAINWGEVTPSDEYSR